MGACVIINKGLIFCSDRLVLFVWGLLPDAPILIVDIYKLLSSSAPCCAVSPAGRLKRTRQAFSGAAHVHWKAERLPQGRDASCV